MSGSGWISLGTNAMKTYSLIQTIGPRTLILDGVTAINTIDKTQRLANINRITLQNAIKQANSLRRISHDQSKIY